MYTLDVLVLTQHLQVDMPEELPDGTVEPKVETIQTMMINLNQVVEVEEQQI